MIPIVIPKSGAAVMHLVKNMGRTDGMERQLAGGKVAGRGKVAGNARMASGKARHRRREDS